MIEFFIAKRYSISKNKVNFITFISLLSTLGITIGVAALIIVLSIFNGFGSIVTSMMVNFDPHIKVNITNNNYNDKDLLAFKSYIKQNEKIKTATPFIEGKIVLMRKNNYQIVNLKGIKQQKNNISNIDKSLIAGKFDLNENSKVPPIIIGYPIALRLASKIGDTVSASSFANIERLVSDMSFPRINRFVVKGIFKTNNKDYDYGIIFSNLEQTQNVLEQREKINGYEITLNNIDDSEEIKNNLSALLNEKVFKIHSWFDLHKDLYTVMLIERWAAYLVLTLIIAIAAFNILSSLTMSVIEKRKDIGVLRAIGIEKKSIIKIFLFEGLLIGVIGTIAGIILGLGICYLQINYNLYSLDAGKYIIDSLPLEIRITDIISIAGMSLFLSFIASLYPAKKTIKTSIADAIKWE